MTIYLIRHGKTEANEKWLYCGSTDLPLSATGRAELQNKHYAIKNAVDPRFREVDFGVFEMRSYEELKAVPEYQTWLNGDNEANIPPEGESGQQMKERVLQAFSCIREDTCLITHGGVIAAIMEHLFPEEKKDRYQWQPKPGCGYVLSENGSFDTL